jgi:hypothetical protein
MGCGQPQLLLCGKERVFHCQLETGVIALQHSPVRTPSSHSLCTACEQNRTGC